MADASSSGNAASSPLDAERQKLKAQGYTDAEISQILIARAVGGQQQSHSSPQGTLSNVLSSIVAIAGHARGLVPSFRTDFATIFSAGAPIGARVGSAFSLVIKTAVIAVLAYAGWQEWQQHIVSATAIADSEVRKRHAEECSARMKVIVDTVAMDKWGPAMAAYEKDCDPTYPVRAQKCETKYKALLNDVNSFLGPDGDKKLKARFDDYKQDCSFTAAQIEELKQKVAAPPPEMPPEEKKKAVEALLPVLDTLDMFSELAKSVHAAMSKQDYDKAFTLMRPVATYYGALKTITDADKAEDWAAGLKGAESLKSVVEQPGVIDKAKRDEQLNIALVSISWYALMVKDYQKALTASQQAVALHPDDLVPKTNQAHALLLLGRVDEAKAIYYKYKGKPLQGKKWEIVVNEDFQKLIKNHIELDAMFDITAHLGAPISLLRGRP